MNLEQSHQHSTQLREPLRHEIPKDVDPPGLFEGKVSQCACGAQHIGYRRGVAVWVGARNFLVVQIP